MKYIIYIIIFLLPVIVNAKEVTVNDFRKKPLVCLKVDKMLEQTAKYKAEEMSRLNYFAHENPDGEGVWVIYKKFGVSLDNWGEILAIGYAKKDVFKAWMDSPTHKSVIIDKDYRYYGCYFGEISVCHFR